MNLSVKVMPENNSLNSDKISAIKEMMKSCMAKKQ